MGISSPFERAMIVMDAGQGTQSDGGNFRAGRTTCNFFYGLRTQDTPVSRGGLSFKTSDRESARQGADETRRIANYILVRWGFLLGVGTVMDIAITDIVSHSKNIIPRC
jgi:hypothetical protein